MRVATFILLSLWALSARAQNSLVTLNGISDLKIGMKQAEVEKVLGQKIKLPHATKKTEDYTRDSLHINYKGIDVDLVFDLQYISENKYEVVLWEITSRNTSLKTKSGIGVGDDKLKIVATYDGYIIWLMPDYLHDSEGKDKTKSTVWLHGDTSGTVLIFYMENNKVTGFSVQYDEGC
ncbi:MAG TPA: hypothetical protein VHK91_10020 [Flavisolibacter sp.]|jgi:hypothetical protein|nr:hypothetical protein [Flavisolibacter sp.]